MKCKSCGHEWTEEVKRIRIGDWEYDVEITQKNKLFSELEKPEGAELWKVSDFEKMGKKEFDELKLWNEWFFIKQHMKAMEEKGYVAWFNANSNRAYLYCGGNPSDRDASLGVRWKWKVKK